MNTTSLKRLLDTCFLAKHIVETMPELPKDMKPRHIHVMDAIQEIEKMQGECRVSDVSGQLNITTPSVTKLIQELEKLGMVVKRSDDRDKRVSLLRLTDEGMQCVNKHVLKFHAEWAKELADVTDEQVQEAIEIIEKLQRAMPGLERGADRNGK